MANRQTTFLIKRSNVPGKIPPSSGLTLGELALNTADAILYTSGTTQGQILPIGWDRIHRTGDTVYGNFNFYGDVQISGSTQPGGYSLSITGDTYLSGNSYHLGNQYITGGTNQIGNFTITGNTTQSGSTFQIGDFNITGITNQIGDFNITGNTNQIGDFTITGDTTQLGNFVITGDTSQIGDFNITGTTNQIGDINLTGNTNQIGDFTISGDTSQTGNTNQLGYVFIVSADTGCTLAVTGETCLTGPVNITGNTLIDGNLSADTLTLTNVPNLNNTLFQILGRNETTGLVEYRQVNTIGNNVTIISAGTYSAQTTIDNVIGVDTSTGLATIYLPDSVSSGRLRFEIKDIGLQAFDNPITIVAAGTDTIISYVNTQTLVMESEGGAIILLNTGLGQWWQM